jgi:hypothetical protein
MTRGHGSTPKTDEEVSYPLDEESEPQSDPKTERQGGTG